MYKTTKYVKIIGLVLIISLSLMEIGISEELEDTIAAGKQEYSRSCAICHGDSGKGDGVYAPKLLVKPSNLTLLQKENNGKFPIREIFLMIEGREGAKYHGPREMPILGDRFDHESVLFVDSRFKRTFVRGRIFELLLYLEEIQIE